VHFILAYLLNKPPEIDIPILLRRVNYNDVIIHDSAPLFGDPVKSIRDRIKALRPFYYEK
tara:strand:+ start:294 stop:473 length:180 start_codon:yes stop_codon:yes gene_type:complete